ncbi:hypothetical protein OG616_31465 [Streptomyces antibioticus]|uniref:hypothetical protein n=1 Tax=Streptomyces antibioticus TaxID=1890 RepID=UPI00224F9185|nr:hypothetical protein [Streptomyces antibioticus]MCX5172526.1 hypothetical protein [Streptomyces antibioticus]
MILVKPTLGASQLRGSLTQYLTTTYALADEKTRLALEQFLGPPETGIFRGPYLRIRTPFHPTTDGGRRSSDSRRAHRGGNRRRLGSG